MRKTLPTWPPVHAESDLHQACADNDHDRAEEIIGKLMSGEDGGTKELKRRLLHPSDDNKQAWTRPSPSPDLQP